MFLAGQV